MAGLKGIRQLSTKISTSNSSSSLASQNSATLFDKWREFIKPIALKKWIPGMYPETEEERKAAAEKYGLHPYEYKPYPNDEHSVGDYPELPQLSVEAQDPYYPWDFPASRRNYNEPVHRHFDIMGPDHVAYGVRTREDYHKCALIFVGLIVSYLVFSLHTVDTKPAFAEKQYPGKGKVHYTFEPAK